MTRKSEVEDKVRCWRAQRNVQKNNEHPNKPVKAVRLKLAGVTGS